LLIEIDNFQGILVNKSYTVNEYSEGVMLNTLTGSTEGVLSESNLADVVITEEGR
jgi:hypothetical protein